MPFHVWGDEWFQENGKDLDAAIGYIQDYVEKHSLCYVVCKEKYGTFRVDGLICKLDRFSAYLNIRIPFLTRQTQYGTMPVYLFHWYSSRLRQRIILHGWRVLWDAVQEAIDKWSHIKDELLEDLAINEWLVGQEIHNQYWRS